ncbi:MAG: hypothetical protein R3C97_10315 [Geminicoccaceae bacterium]
MKRFTISFLAALALFARADAEPLQPGVSYPGGTILDVRGVGLSLAVPDGWSAVLPQGENFLVLTPDERRFVFLLAENAGLADAGDFLSRPVQIGGGVTLQPIAQSRDGNDLVVDFNVDGTAEPYRAGARVRAFGTRIVAALAAAPQAELAKVRQVAAMVLDGIGELAATGGGASEWQTYLMGRHLVRYVTEDDYYEERHAFLCSDGHFRWYVSSGGSTEYLDQSTASVYARSGNTGRWRAEGSGDVGVVHLDHDDGSRSEIEVAIRNGQFHVDGRRWFRSSENSNCD